MLTQLQLQSIEEAIVHLWPWHHVQVCWRPDPSDKPALAVSQALCRCRQWLHGVMLCIQVPPAVLPGQDRSTPHLASAQLQQVLWNQMA